MRVRIARDELRRIRELSQTIKALEAEIAGLVAQIAPQLLTEPGLGPLTAAKLVGEIAGAEPLRQRRQARARRRTRADPGQLRQHQPPPPRSRRQPPDQRAPFTASPSPAPAATPRPSDYLARKTAEGKTTREAIRCLKRHLARRIWHLLQAAPPRTRNTATPINFLT